MNKYIRYIKLNKNIIFGFIASFIVSAIVSNLFSTLPAHINSTIVLIVDFAVYFSVFGTLYWFDNKKRYYDSGVFNRQTFQKDISKIILSLGIGEVVYSVSRWYLHYHFLTIDVEAFDASVLAQGISTLIYFIIVNFIIWVTRAYKDGH